MPNFTFTPEALDDLQQIVNSTIEQWDKTQAKSYVQGLQLLSSRLANNPYLGKNRPELSNKLYSFPYVSHFLFCTETLKGIIIIHVLHKSMDIAHHL